MFGPGSASLIPPLGSEGRLLDILSELYGPDGDRVKFTEWAHWYYDENGDRKVNSGIVGNASFQICFTARTPIKVVQGTTIDNSNAQLWLKAAATVAKTRGFAEGKVAPDRIVETGNANGIAIGTIQVRAGL